MTDKALCPYSVQEAFRNYLEGVPPGGFVRAMLECDLKSACLQADAHNARHIADIFAYMYWELPADAWGSAEAVDRFLSASGVFAGRRSSIDTEIDRSRQREAERRG